MHEGEESVGTRLRVDIPREALSPLGKGSMRRNRNGEIFSTRDREPELESLGALVRNC